MLKGAWVPRAIPIVEQLRARGYRFGTLLHYAYSFEYGDVVGTRLRERIVQLVGLSGLAICLVYRSMAMIDWAIHHDTPDAVRFWVRGGWRVLDDLTC